MRFTGNPSFISIEMKVLFIFLILTVVKADKESCYPPTLSKDACIQDCGCGWCDHLGCFIYRRDIKCLPNGTTTEHNSERCKDIRLVFGNVGIITMVALIAIVIWVLVICTYSWFRWGRGCQLHRVGFSRMRDEYDII